MLGKENAPEHCEKVVHLPLAEGIRTQVRELAKGTSTHSNTDNWETL